MVLYRVVVIVYCIGAIDRSGLIFVIVNDEANAKRTHTDHPTT